MPVFCSSQASTMYNGKKYYIIYILFCHFFFSYTKPKHRFLYLVCWNSYKAYLFSQNIGQCKESAQMYFLTGVSLFTRVPFPFSIKAFIWADIIVYLAVAGFSRTPCISVIWSDTFWKLSTTAPHSQHNLLWIPFSTCASNTFLLVCNKRVCLTFCVEASFEAQEVRQFRRFSDWPDAVGWLTRNFVVEKLVLVRDHPQEPLV